MSSESETIHRTSEDNLVSSLSEFKGGELVIVSAFNRPQFPAPSWLAMEIEEVPEGLLVPASSHAGRIATRPGVTIDPISMESEKLDLSDLFGRYLNKNEVDPSKREDSSAISVIQGADAYTVLRSLRRNDEDPQAIKYLRGLSVKSSGIEAPVIYPTKQENNLGPKPMGYSRSL